MPAKANATELDVEVGSLETLPLDPGASTGTPYPLQALAPTDRTQQLELEVVELASETLRALICPALGGRLVAFMDRRSSSAALPVPNALSPTAGGVRGAELPYGLELLVGDGDRPNSMGPIEAQVQEPAEDGAPAAVIVHELVSGQPISWTACFSASDRRTEMLIELRATNRSAMPVANVTGVRLHTTASVRLGQDCCTVYDTETDAGWLLRWEAGAFDRVTFDGGRLDVVVDAPLTPRKSASWKVWVQPLSALSGEVVGAPEASASLSDSALRLDVAEERPGAKLFLLTEDGQTLEAVADLSPLAPHVVDLGGLPSKPVSLVVRSAAEESLLRLDRESQSEFQGQADLLPQARTVAVRLTDLPDSARESHYVRATELLDKGEDPTAFARSSERCAGLEAASLALRATYALREQRWQDAFELCEAALGHDAGDHLLWWMRAAANRHGGIEPDDAGLQNAHFLAPLEPMLRVEGFLAQDQQASAEPNPILKPLAAHPEALADCVCRLIECGLKMDASRLLDEALRHRDHANLRYLYAWMLIGQSRMEVEAMDQVRRAERLPLDPPYPWRPMEVRAVRELSDRAPESDRLRRLRALVDAFA